MEQAFTFPHLTRQGSIVARLMSALAAILLLVGCTEFTPASISRTNPTEQDEAINEFRVVPNTRSFLNAPNALIVLERQLGNAVEQRVTLPNPTSLAGENLILMRAQTPRTASATRLVLRDVLEQFGGPPTPFGTITDSSLTATSDAYGDLTYTVMRPGGDLVCVLAFRRTQTASRMLPSGASALDIMMRNCVPGSLEAALAPIGAGAFGLASPVFR